MKAVGRNEPCLCKSGKKFKFCCLLQFNTKKKECVVEQNPMLQDPEWLMVRQAEGVIEVALQEFVEKEFNNAYVNAWKEFTSVSEVEVDAAVYEPYFKTWLNYTWLAFDEDDDVGSSVAEICLKKYPERFTEYEAEVLQTVVESPFSFFTVKEVVKGKSVVIKDLFLDRELHVKEVIGTKKLEKGTILFCRPVTLENQTIFVGLANYTIPPQLLNMVTDFRNKLLESVKQDAFTTGDLLELEMILRKAYFFIIEWAFQSKKVKKTDEADVLESKTAPEKMESLSELITNHYKKWLEAKIPELDGLSPREAACTPSGKEKLEVIFQGFEKSNIELAAKGQEYRQVDIAFLKRELAILST